MVISDVSLCGRAPAATGRARRDIDGLVLLDKPLGVTSNHALQRVKRLFGARKAGHTGSLDPLATGMLPICLGQATKISAFLLASDKAYRVRICFGSQTATGDAEGPVIHVGPDKVHQLDLERVLDAFRGAVPQTPPMYSALKVNGRRLYELARAGQDVSRTPRIVQIHGLRIECYDPVRPVLQVLCSKGTYIRSLAEDIARAAGTVGHVAELRRLSVGPFPEAAMCTLDDLEAAAGSPEQFLMPSDAAVPNWPAVRLPQSEALNILYGRLAAEGMQTPGGMVRLYDEDGRFLGVGERLGDGQIRPRRLMIASEPPSLAQNRL